MKKRMLVLGLMAGLSACAQPMTLRPGVDARATAAEELAEKKLFLQQMRQDEKRLQDVGWRLEAAALPMCPAHTRWSSGFSYQSLVMYKRPYHAAARALGVHDRVSVAAVAPDSPAAKAGLRPGDVLERMDGLTLPPGVPGMKVIAETSDRPLRQDWVVKRAGKEVDLSWLPVKVCNYPIGLEPGQQINAYADGKAVHVYEGMMTFATSDDQLAVVLGHELAHDIRGHIEDKKRNALEGELGGSLLDIAAAAFGVNTNGAFSNEGARMGAQAYSRDFEAEADYVGLYIAARAGFNIEAGPMLWRRMAVAAPGSITMATDHPTSPQRFVAMQATIKEIEAKEAAHQPLLPNEKTK